MGVYTEHGLYQPDIGEVGWGTLVDDNFTLLDPAVGGGGGGGGTANLIDVTSAPYSADPTGTNFADTAIQNAFDAAFNIGAGSGVWLPGIFKVKKNLAHFTVNGITVAMPRGAKFLIGDDMGGDSLFSCLGRHGFSENETCDGTFLGINVDGNGRQFAGGIWADWWQGQDQVWRDIQVWDFKGAVWSFTGCRRPRIDGFTLTNVGAGESGDAAVDWHHSDEGGLIGRLTEYGVLTNGTIVDCDDFPVYWKLAYACAMNNVRIDGSGLYRPGFAGVDLSFCTIQGNTILNAYEDCMRLSTRGIATSGIDGTFSHDNVVTGNVMLGENDGAGGGGFYGIREFAPYTDVSHAGNVIENNVGTVQSD